MLQMSEALLLSMQKIKRACFNALNSSVNNTFKVFNIANGHNWHAGMQVIEILDQLSNIYGISDIANGLGWHTAMPVISILDQLTTSMENNVVGPLDQQQRLLQPILGH
jgi:hypothetical protein